MASLRFLGDTDLSDPKVLQQYEKLAEEDDDDGDEFSIANLEWMHPRVVNMVATVACGIELDLYRIATTARNAEYNPCRFGAVILRIQEPKATALVFKTGTINIVGCRKEEDAQLAARKFGRMMKLLGYPPKKTFLGSFSIKNMVAVIDFGKPVRLEAITNDVGHRQFAKYNPEVFAGCIYKIPEPRVTFLIFASGKIVMTGAKSREMLMEAAEWIHPILQLFERPRDSMAMGIPEPQEQLEPEEQPEPEKPLEVKEEKPKEKKPKVFNPFKRRPLRT